MLLNFLADATGSDSAGRNCMKAGWSLATLGAVAQVGAGNSAPQGEPLFADGTYPFFRTSDAGRVRFGDIEESSD